MQSFYHLTPEEQAARFQDLAAKALNHWDIWGNSRLELIKHRENAVFRVDDIDTDRRYALRVHRYGYHSDAELKSELQWMKEINTNGISTPNVVAGTDGSDLQIVSCDGVPKPHQCDLFTWGRWCGPGCH